MAKFPNLDIPLRSNDRILREPITAVRVVLGKKETVTLCESKRSYKVFNVFSKTRDTEGIEDPNSPVASIITSELKELLKNGKVKVGRSIYTIRKTKSLRSRLIDGETFF